MKTNRENIFKVALNGAETHFEAFVDQDVYQKIVEVILKSNTAGAHDPKKVHVYQPEHHEKRQERTAHEKVIPFASFLDHSKARTYVDKFVILAFYLEQELRRPTFSRYDVQDYLGDDPNGIPKNIPREFQAAHEKGYLEPVPEHKSTYALTDFGRSLAKNLVYGRAQRTEAQWARRS